MLQSTFSNSWLITPSKVKNHLESQFLSLIGLIWIKEKNIQSNTSKKVLPGIKSKDGLKSLNYLEIAIKNLNTEPEKQLIWMIEQKKKFWSTEMNC